MKRDFYLVLTGFLSGIILSIYLYRKRKKIMDRLNEIERKVKGIEVKNSIKSLIWETTSSIRKIITNTKGVPLEEKEYILKKVEEKIRKLEEIV
ncbi:hypothetical protein [Persephonella sp.]|nr:hypothetical protein [Aquificota bacterium]